MAQFPALPIWTDALLGDTQHLTTAEFGAYFLMIIVAWRTADCALPNDEKYLARITRSMGNWPRLRPAVMEFWRLGADGKWRQKKLTLTRERAHQKTSRARESAEAKWREYNKTRDAVACDPHSDRNANLNLNQMQEEEEPPMPKEASSPLGGDSHGANGHDDDGSRSPATSGTARSQTPKPRSQRGAAQPGTRLPDDWTPGTEAERFARQLGLDPEQVVAEFRDYWCSLPGAKARKLDWTRTFKNRCREVAGRSSRQPKPQKDRGSLMDFAAAAYEAAARTKVRRSDDG